mgnify:CR=1 FL=1
MTKLFIGNLPYTATDQDIQNLFANAGQVLSAVVIMDKFSGKSKGFAFVEMSNDEEAQKAIADLNETEFDGRKIFVSVARPREDRPQGGGFSNDRRGGGNSGGFRNDRNDRRR